MCLAGWAGSLCNSYGSGIGKGCLAKETDETTKTASDWGTLRRTKFKRKLISMSKPNINDQ